MVLITLNIVCAFAICLFTSLEKYETNLPKNPGTIIGKNINNQITTTPPRSSPRKPHDREAYKPARN